MSRFRLSEDVIDAGQEKRALEHVAAGACVEFEGRVRDHNGGRRVQRLDYQAYVPLARDEGEAIIVAACARFGLRDARCVHRLGRLAIGEVAVWVGVSADHREAAFSACRFIIDEIKRRVPIWKNEHYADGDSGWLHPDDTAVDSSGR
ncbi:MAG TPA: molybdenum cofactor biosynthesis protein MoaE [Rhodanobacteraceae bacterium]|nr:molybdenum cofactor biosynthesis protein MoaE [Rhodanobacteraceae bacterium]